MSPDQHPDRPLDQHLAGRRAAVVERLAHRTEAAGVGAVPSLAATIIQAVAASA